MSELSKSTRPLLIRLPGLFEGISAELWQTLGAVPTKRLGQEYHWVNLDPSRHLGEAEASVFLRWSLPLEQTWPCQPAKIDGFIEKAAQSLLAKFGPRKPQGVFTGALHPTSPDRYFRSLASNLRGRLVLLFPELTAKTVEEQDPGKESLFVLVGKEGLYAGMSTPRAANGFHPGGSRYIAQDEPETISRAGAKIAEAIHYLALHRPGLPERAHWLELGACPGGMTSELLARGYRVTAIDRAPLDPRLNRRSGLTFVLDDVARFDPPRDTFYDAILCDMNGSPEESIAQVVRLSRSLKRGGLVVFTLKLPRVDTVAEPLSWVRHIVSKAKSAGLRHFAKTHLTYNRHEFTLFFETRRD